MTNHCNCEECRLLRARVKMLVGPQPSAGLILAKLVFGVLILPFVIFGILTQIDYRIQVQAQHPDWERRQVADEAFNRQFGNWNAFSIFTYRPLADTKR